MINRTLLKPASLLGLDLEAKKNMIMRILSALFGLLLLVPQNLTGTERLEAEPLLPAPLLYRNIDFGSESVMNPVNYYLNGAFDTFQLNNNWNQKFFFESHLEVFRRIFNPLKSIGEVRVFLENEFLGWNAMPNYTLHLVGGGFDFRTMKEWYTEHGFKWPLAWAIVNSYLVHLGNEAIESTSPVTADYDHIADLLFFDVAAKFLFSNDNVVRFFRDQAKMRAWHSMPMWIQSIHQFRNSAINYVFRPLIWGETVRPFSYVGMVNLLGASLRLTGRDYLSAGLGFSVQDIEYRFVGPQGRLALGIFYDRDESLMASLILNASEGYIARLNLYPGLVNLYPGFYQGFFAAIDNNKQVYFGLHIMHTFGLGHGF